MLERGLLLGRFISTLGSILTSSSILFYLVSSGRERDIPTNVIAVALGSLLASRVIVPKIARWSMRPTLVLTTGLGLLADLLLALYGWIHQQIFPSLLLSAAVFLFSMLSTIDFAASQSALGSAEKGNPRLVHLDSTLTTAARVISPSIAATILALLGTRLSWILLVDGVTYFLAMILFVACTHKLIPNETPLSKPTKVRFTELFRKRPRFWLSASLTTLGAAAYNGCAVIYFRHIGLSVTELSLFMTVQNAAMVSTSFLLVRKPELTRHQPVMIALAAIGLCALSRFNTLPLLMISTAILAFGMVVTNQTYRAILATSPEPMENKKVELGTLAMVNSSVGMLGVALFSSLEQVIAIDAVLLAGSAVLLAAGIFCAFRPIEELVFRPISEKA